MIWCSDSDAADSGGGGSGADNSSGCVPSIETHPHWLQFPPPTIGVHYALGGVLLAVGTAGIMGNALVLFVFTRFRRLRGPFSAFIVNLAVADLCTSLLHAMAAASSFRGHWIFGSLGCKLYACAVGHFGLLSIVTLAAIAVERYMVITAKPLSGSWKMTQYGARKVCAGAWLYCLLMSLPPLLGWSRYIPEGFLTSCSWDYLTRSRSNRAYYVYLLVLGFVLPVCVIAYCYAFILATIHAHGREMRSVETSGGKQRLRRSCSHLQPHSTTVRTVEIIATLVTLFLLSWTPYAVVTLIGQFGDVSLMTPWVSSLPAYFAKASVVYNPIVYGLSHPHFRTSVKQYLSTMRGGGGATSASHLPPPPPPPTTSSPPPQSHCQHVRCFPPHHQQQQQRRPGWGRGRRQTAGAHFHSEPPDPRTAARRVGALPPSARRVQISTTAPVCCVVYQSGGGRVCCVRAAPVPPVFDL